MSFEAAYESKCADCGSTIRVGELVEASDLETVGDVMYKPWWQHEVCPPGKLDITREVCAECFTEKSVDGSCMCGAI